MCSWLARHSGEMRVPAAVNVAGARQDPDVSPGQGASGGLRQVEVPPGRTSAARKCEAEEREGRTPLDRPRQLVISALGGTAVSIEREVVSGHAYAILAPDTVTDGGC